MSRRAPRRSEALSKETATIINAAALQDHLMRSMALNAPQPRLTNTFARGRAQPPPEQPQQTTEPVAPKPISFRKEPRLSTRVTNAKVPHAVVAPTTSGSLATQYRRVWVCEKCTFENDDWKPSGHGSHNNQHERCGACGELRPSRPRRQQTTLAQQRGLVPAPEPKLSRDEWERCETQALDRGDALHPCSICREPSGVQEQVLLSCSHMFHLACMQSFERFLRTKQRVCPLCRKENYQKRMTSRAAGIHREKCAARIQAMCRGHRARKRVEALWHDFYRRGKGDPIRRRAFLAKRVGKTADRLVSAMRARDDSIDSLLAEFDRTITLSKQVFSESQPQTDDDCAPKIPAGPDWAKIFLKARARDDKECPICIHAFNASMLDAALLTCSHVFHRECLLAFEEFNIYEIPLCPLCRSGYQSRCWSDVKKEV